MGQTRQLGFEEFLKATNTTSFIVIKDDTILYEGYFNGYTRDSIVTSFSMAKSFTSALIGIAIDEGYIGSVNNPVIAYLPELRGRGLDDLTIRHLFTMSSGIRYVHDDAVSPLRDLTQFTDDGMSSSYTCGGASATRTAATPTRPTANGGSASRCRRAQGWSWCASASTWAVWTPGRT